MPKIPPKLSDINFFTMDQEGIPPKAKKERKAKDPNETPCHELSEGSSSDLFDNSEATLKEIFDSYDPGKHLLSLVAVALCRCLYIDIYTDVVQHLIS